MKKLRKLSVIILSLCLILSCSISSFASTGYRSTPIGVIYDSNQRYYIQGTITVQTKQITAYAGFTDPSVYIYPEYTITINATYVNDTTGAAGSISYSYRTMAPNLTVKYAPPTNCSYTGASVTFKATYKTQTWAENLSL